MLVRLQAEPLDLLEVQRAVDDPACGGQAFFVGVVRDHDSARPVERLSYEAHPGAVETLVRVCGEAADRDGVRHVAAVHRTGELVVGDAAVVVAVSSAHRAEALEACRWLIDTIKHEVPIWKHQVFADGTTEWVGAC